MHEGASNDDFHVSVFMFVFMFMFGCSSVRVEHTYRGTKHSATLALELVVVGRHDVLHLAPKMSVVKYTELGSSEPTQICRESSNESESEPETEEGSSSGECACMKSRCKTCRYTSAKSRFQQTTNASVLCVLFLTCSSSLQKLEAIDTGWIEPVPAVYAKRTG